MNKKNVFQWLVIAAGMLIAAYGFYMVRPRTGELILINQADEAAVKTTVEINHVKFDFADLPPGAARKIKFKIEIVNHYTVSVEFRYERKLELQAGVFGDKQSSHQLVIKHDQIVLESGAE